VETAERGTTLDVKKTILKSRPRDETPPKRRGGHPLVFVSLNQRWSKKVDNQNLPKPSETKP